MQDVVPLNVATFIIAKSLAALTIEVAAECINIFSILSHSRLPHTPCLCPTSWL